jgi:hypothetical protein
MRLFEIAPEILPGYGKKFTLDNIDDAIERIKIDCSDAVIAMRESGHFLYRGMEYTHPEIFVARSRINRKALHSHALLSSMIDHALIAAGMSAIRSNSVFCTTNDSTANTYGDIFYIFPKNGFDFTYTKHEDLFTGIEAIVDSEIKRIMGNPAFTKPIKELILARFEKQGFDAVPYEVYEWAQSANVYRSAEVLHWLRTATDIPPNLTPKPLSVEDIIKNIDPKNDSFHSALSAGVEILIHGDYYAIKRNLFRPQIENLIWAQQ